MMASPARLRRISPPSFEPAHQLLVDLERYPVEVGQQCLAVDSLFPKALADPVLLL